MKFQFRAFAMKQIRLPRLITGDNAAILCPYNVREAVGHQLMRTLTGETIIHCQNGQSRYALCSSPTNDIRTFRLVQDTSRTICVPYPTHIQASGTVTCADDEEPVMLSVKSGERDLRSVRSYAHTAGYMRARTYCFLPCSKLELL